MDGSVRVRVPASTSNLGPGFDLLGLALSLWLEVRVEGPAESGRHELRAAGPGAARWPAPEEDLLLRALEQVRGGRGGPLRVQVTSEIPVGRGLGSSGAAVAAGLLLGAALADEAPDDDALLELGIELEGHPDNVAASLRGGCTLCVPGSPPTVLRQELHPDLGFALAWPEEPLATARARAALPDRVPLADAVENARRLALLLEGLRSGSPELLARGGEDRLHVPWRLPSIPGAARALEAARAGDAWLATISGSGSALVAIGPRERAAAIAEAMAAAFRAETGAGEGRAVEPVLEAPRAQPY